MTSVEESGVNYMSQVDDPTDYKNQITDFSKDDNGQSNDDENNALKNDSEFYTNGQDDQENNFSNNNMNNEMEDNNNSQLNDENNQNDENKMNRNNQNMEPEQFRKVFIGGLSYKTDDETLKNYFLKYGELVDYVVMKDGQTGRSRGFGFVTYSDSFMVDELMKNRPHIIDGRQVEPKRATPREDSGKSEVQMTVKKLFIGGLRDNITEDDLKRYFGNYGSIVEAVVMKEKESSKSRGFGFVTFDDYDPVDKIILEKNHVINGVNVHTQKALPKDFEKGGQNNNNNNGNNRQGNRNNNFSNDNFNYNNQGSNFNSGYNSGGGYQRNGSMGGGIQSNQFDNGFSNSSLNNTYGSYNQAPNQPKMNMTGGGGGGQNNMPMGGNRNMPIGGNRGGPGPMRGGGRFTNRSSGPYGGGGGFNGNNGNGGGNFNRGNNRMGGGGGGRGGRGGRGGFSGPRGNGNNGNNNGNGNMPQ